jgi:hypothetical protein
MTECRHTPGSPGGLGRPRSETGLAAPAQPAPAFNLGAAIKRCKKKFPKGSKRKRCIKRARKLAL